VLQGTVYGMELFVLLLKIHTSPNPVVEVWSQFAVIRFSSYLVKLLVHSFKLGDSILHR